MSLLVDRFRFAQFVVFGLTLMAIPMVTLAAESDKPASSDCPSIQDDAARLACYDNSNSQPQPSSPPPPAIADVPPVEESPAIDSLPVAEPQQLDDDVGREALGRKEGEQELAVQGRVVRCQENKMGTLFFHFDNGQIWEKKGSTRLAWEECSFDVAISKDFFGYKMVRDGEKRYIRIARVK